MNSQATVDYFPTISVPELFRLTLRYVWSAVFLSLLFAVLFAVGVFLIPVKYDSEAQINVTLGRGTTALDPSADLTQNVALQESRQSQVNSVKELLIGRELASRVVAKVGADRITAPRSWVEQQTENVLSLVPSFGKQSSGPMSAEEVKEQIALEEACAAIFSNLLVSSPKEAHTIFLRYRSGDPYLSQDVMSTVLDEYSKLHVESYRSNDSLAHFEKDLTEARLKAVEAQQKLHQTRTLKGLLDTGSAKDALQNQHVETQTELSRVQREIAETDSEINALILELAQIPEKIESEVLLGVTKKAGDTIRQKLYELEIEQKELQAKYRDGHPALVAVEDQLKLARQTAEEEIGEQPQQKQSINPVQQQLEVDLRTAKSKSAGLKTRFEKLTSQMELLNQRISQLNSDELELTQLEWNAQLAEQDYFRTADICAKARQIDSLDQEGISEIRVVQNASLQLKKAAPKRLLLLMVSTAFAVTLGLGSAVARALIFSSTQTHRDHNLAHRDHNLESEQTAKVHAPMAGHAAISDSDFDARDMRSPCPQISGYANTNTDPPGYHSPQRSSETRNSETRNSETRNGEALVWSSRVGS